jgi:hypothetical protein
MPPAFNLSQDQTLQLNCFADPSNYLLLCITQSKRGLLLCEHLLDALPLAGGILADPTPEGVRKPLRVAPSIQAPTLIGCEFLKSEHPRVLVLLGCGDRI